MSPPKPKPWSEFTDEEKRNWLEYEQACVDIDNDPDMRQKHQNWLAHKPWPGPIPVSPIVTAKLAAYSKICLKNTVADEFRKILTKS